MKVSETTFLFAKWQPNIPVDSGYYLSQRFTGAHVSALQAMLKTYISKDVDIACMTDDDSDLPSGVRGIPIPESAVPVDHLPKLGIYDDQVNSQMRPNIIYLDLDVMITGDFLSKLPDPEPLAVLATSHIKILGLPILDHRLPIGATLRRLLRNKESEKKLLGPQKLNTSVVVFKRNSMAWLREQFDYDSYSSSKANYERQGLSGTDQLYLTSKLAAIPSWKPLGPKEGIYCPHPFQIRHQILPGNHKLLVFPGKDRNPWQLAKSPGYEWIEEEYGSVGIDLGTL